MKILRLISVLLSVLTSVSTYAEQAQLRLSVVDGRTGFSIPAVVELQGDNGHEQYEIIKGARLELLLKPGNYSITCHATGYGSQTAAYSLSGGQLIKLSVQLDALNGFMPSVPVGKAIVCGYVRDEETQLPMVNALVQSSTGAEVITDATGYFEFESSHYTAKGSDGKKPVTCELQVTKTGYASITYEHLPLYEDRLCLKLALQPGNGTTTLTWKHKLIDVEPESSVPDAPVTNGAAQGAASCTVPQVVRLNTGGNNLPCTSCSGCITIVQLSMENYVSTGLDDEWIASWNDESLKAGAVAYRTYGAYWVNHPMNANYDIVAYPCKQHWNGTTSSSYTVNAAAATAGEVLVDGSNAIAFSEYAAETNNFGCGNGYTGCTTCGAPVWPCVSDAVCAGSTSSGHWRGMCQWGSHRWAQQGQLYTWILDHYYTPGNLTLCYGQPAGCSAAPGNNSCYSPTTLPIGNSCSTVAGDVCLATQSIAPGTCSGNTAATALDVWYTITPSQSNVTITCQSGTNMNAVMGLYSGACPNFTLLQCSDSSGAGGRERINASLTSGTTYFVRVYDYTGNTAGTDFTICAQYTLPDLLITPASATAPATAAAGTSINVACSETNAGVASAGANVVGVWLSTDAVLNTGTDVYLGAISGFGVLASGSIFSVLNNNFTLANTTAPGSYYLLLRADNGLAVTESDEGNNVMSLPITISCYIPPVPVPNFGTTGCGAGTATFLGAPLMWSGSAPYYQVYCSKYPFGSANLILDTCTTNNGAPLNIGNPLQPGMVYRWNVRSSSNCSNSACSSAISNAYYFHVPPFINYSGPDTVPTGTPITLTTDNQLPGSGATVIYNWYKNNVLVKSSADNFYSGTVTCGAADFRLTISYYGSSVCPPTITTASSLTKTIYGIATASLSLSATPNAICTGQTSQVLLTANYTGDSSATYNWLGITGVQNQNTLTANGVNQTTTVRCTVVSNKTCVVPAQLSDSITILVIQAVTPTIQVMANDTAFCAGGAPTLVASSQYGGSNGSYYWYKNGVYANSTDSSFTTSAADEDSVYCMLVSTYGCVTQDTVYSSPVKFTVYPLPVVTACCDTVRCEGPVALYGTGNGLHIWMDTTGTVLSNNAALVVNPAGEGAYLLTISDPNGCVNTSQKVYVSTAITKPPVAQFALADSLSALQGCTICFENESQNTQHSTWWFGEGDIVQNDSLQLCHTYGAPGVYAVKLQAIETCGVVSDTALIQHIVTVGANCGASGLREAAELPFKITPNPSAGSFAVEVEGFNAPLVELFIYDMLGQELWQESWKNAGAVKQTVQLQVPTGMYIARLKVGQHNHYVKFEIVR
ncbi:MAG: SpoIID/LytB domain-containing protein [Chitinophagales bacterium]